MGRDFLLGNREFPEHGSLDVLPQLAFPGSFHVVRRIGFLGEAEGAFDVGHGIGPGCGHFLLRGIRGNPALLFGVIGHRFVPFLFRLGFQRRLLLLRHIRHLQLRRLLLIQGVVDRPFQAGGLHKGLQFRIRGIISVGAVESEIGILQPQHLLMVAPDLVSVHGSQQNRLLRLCQIRNHRGIRSFRRRSHQAPGQQHQGRQNRRQHSAPVIIPHGNLLSVPGYPAPDGIIIQIPSPDKDPNVNVL